MTQLTRNQQRRNPSAGVSELCEATLPPFDRAECERLLEMNRRMMRPLDRYVYDGGVLSRGAQRAEVKELQEQLNRLVGRTVIPETGNFGPITDRVVRQFQRDFGLRVDGDVGVETLAAIQRLRLGGERWVPGERSAVAVRNRMGGDFSERLAGEGKHVPRARAESIPERTVVKSKKVEVKPGQLGPGTAGEKLPDLSKFAPAERGAFYRRYTDAEGAAIGEQLKRVVEAKGGRWQPGLNIVAVKGMDLDKGPVKNHNNRFDDALCFVKDDGKGSFEVLVTRAATQSGLAKIPEHLEQLNKLDERYQHLYMPGAHGKGGKSPEPGDGAARLANGVTRGLGMDADGRYTLETTITAANIHWLKRDSSKIKPTTPVENSSIGCPVVACSRAEFNRVVTPFINSDPDGRFLLTIIDPNEDRSQIGTGKPPSRKGSGGVELSNLRIEGLEGYRVTKEPGYVMPGGRIPDGQTPGIKAKIDLVELQPNLKLRPDAALAFAEMQKAAEAAGLGQLRISGGKGFRNDMEQQAELDQVAAKRDQFILEQIEKGMNPEEAKALAREKVPGANPIGVSTHQFGTAFDLRLSGNEAQVRWVRENAGRFGFVAPHANEPWHYEYRGGSPVGIELAKRR